MEKKYLSVNDLPLFEGKVEEFIFDANQKFRFQLGIKSNLLKRAFWEKGVDVVTWKDRNGRFKWHAIGENKSLRFRDTMSYLTRESTRKLTNSKAETKKMLSKAGISTPAGILVKKHDIEKISSWYDGLPENSILVAKPVDGTSGKDVYPYIRSKDELLHSVSCIQADNIVIEEYVHGYDTRILVVGGKAIAAQKRYSAFVIGDGVSSVSKLIEEKNKIRATLPYFRIYPIVVDDITLKLLDEQGFHLNDLPKKGERLTLKRVANIGAGGENQEIFDKMHPGFIEIAEKCWHAFPHVTHCGIDLLSSDITQSPESQKWAVIEVNVNCDLPIHHFPYEGKAYNVSKSVADYLLSDHKDTQKIAVSGSFVLTRHDNVFLNIIVKNAVAMGINGFCQKEKDSIVKFVFEGSDVALKRLLAVIVKGSPRSNVISMSRTQVPVVVYNGFVIK